MLSTKAFLTLFNQLDSDKQLAVFWDICHMPLIYRDAHAGSIALKEKLTGIIKNAEEEINNYLYDEENHFRTNITLNSIRELCLNCDEKHELTHYPTLRFSGYFGKNGSEMDEDIVELGAEVVVNMDNNFTTTLNIEDAGSMAKFYEAHKTIRDEGWIVKYYWNDSNPTGIDNDITLFVNDISVLLQIYYNVLLTRR